MVKVVNFMLCIFYHNVKKKIWKIEGKDVLIQYIKFKLKKKN